MSDPHVPAELPADVIDALRRGRRHEAIRRLREEHGMDPREARVLVELHAPANRQEPGLTEPTRGGGAGWVITLIVIGLILYALFTYVGCAR